MPKNDVDGARHDVADWEYDRDLRIDAGYTFYIRLFRVFFLRLFSVDPINCALFFVQT